MRVNGLTVNRTMLTIPLVPPPVVLTVVRVPALAFGELFGKSWSLTILNVVGPLAQPLTRKM